MLPCKQRVVGSIPILSTNFHSGASRYGSMKKLFALLTLLAFTASTFALSISWQPNPAEQQISNYKVYMATGTGEFTLLANAGTNTAYTLPNLTPGVYRFHVTAENLWGESPAGNTVTTPPAPGSPVKTVLYVIVGGKTNIVVPFSQ